MLVLQRTYKDGVPGPLNLFLEGILVALLGATFAGWLFPDEASLLAVFLAAVSTTDSMERLLLWNRDQIFDQQRPPREANIELALFLLVLFAGTTTGFSILALGLPLDAAEFLFDHQLKDYGGQSIKDLTFGTPVALLLHNTYVVLFFFILAIPFRQGGIMLAVAWNASVWAAAFSTMARNWSATDGPGLIEAYVRILGACAPHMALEAAAYCLAGLAGVFLSKALLKYSLESKELGSVLNSVGLMLALAGFLVVSGALWEGFVAPRLLSVLVGSPV